MGNLISFNEFKKENLNENAIIKKKGNTYKSLKKLENLQKSIQNSKESINNLKELILKRGNDERLHEEYLELINKRNELLKEYKSIINTEINKIK